MPRHRGQSKLSPMERRGSQQQARRHLPIGLVGGGLVVGRLGSRLPARRAWWQGLGWAGERGTGFRV